jgi:drug/metabolite transporter (DMT)-like permease
VTASSERLASLWMLGASLAFAAMAACIKLASDHGMSIWQIALLRGVVALMLLLPYLRLQHLSVMTPNWKAHLSRGVTGFVGMLFYVSAISLLPLATAITLNYLSPVCLALMLLVVHRERPTARMVLSITGGIAGIVLLLRPTYDSSQWYGALMGLASAVTAAIAALNIRHLGRLNEPTARTVFYFSLSITLGSLPGLALSSAASWPALGTAYAAAAGVLATVGQIMLTLAYQRGIAMLASLLGYSQVVFTSLIGIVLWSDKPALGSWLGMALIMASGAAAVIYASQPAKAEGAAKAA